MVGTVYPTVRMRRLRSHPLVRSLVRENELKLDDLVCPIFIKGRKGEKYPIASMPGYHQVPLERLGEEVEEIEKLGIKTVILFGVPPRKDSVGSDSCNEKGVIQEALKLIRSTETNLLVITDLCFCEYTDHGHCGILDEKNEIDNDSTLKLLAAQAVSHAAAGADVVAPSGMIDGMVGAVRQGLDAAGFEHIPILSYSVKYNSSLYGPFRHAAEGAPAFGDRSSHMMDCPNAEEGLREAQLDVAEGADMLMVKPAHAYMDMIYRIKEAFPYMPLGAYHTSGEFCMIKAAAEKGWIDEKRATLEVLTGLRRAGADFIITYFAKDVARWGLYP